MFVSDLVPNVVEKLANRSDIVTKVPKWIKDTVLELTDSYPFEELRTTGPFRNLTVGQAEYSIDYFTNPADTNYTEVVTFFIQITSSTTSSSAPISVGYELEYRTPPVVEPMTFINGTPVYWSQHGNNILIGFNPSISYPVRMKYQRRHPFSTFEKDLPNDVIMMPDNWREIIEYAAAERGAINEIMLDYATTYHQLIFGDPEFERQGVAGKGQPGLIHRRISQRERNMSNNSRQMYPRVSRYTG